MFILHQSNRMERLFEQLAGVIEQPLSQIFQPEVVVVQSQGMARWLSMALARSHGVCANLDCPFPAAFIWKLLERSFDGESASPYQPEVMRWALMELLPVMASRPGFAQVAAYLQGEGPDLRRYHLAGKIAALFDQYLVYRPEWIEEWTAGKGDGWQAVLWREMIARHGARHRAAMLAGLVAQLRSGAALGWTLPERISIFGIPSLPPSQLNFFAALAERIDVHFFLLSPSAQFWTDLVSRQEMARAGIRHGVCDLGEDLHLEEGCRLLMGLGTLGREFQRVLQEFDPHPGLELFDDEEENTLLALVRADLNAAIRRPAPEGDQAGPIQFEDDASILIHAAHSPMREVEILHDQLLDLLMTRPGLEADDILVMMPDIDRYAPLIEAVFSDPADEGRRLPFSIADRAVLGALSRSFVTLLDLLGSRATLPELVAFLDQEPVRVRFGLSGEDLMVIRSWLAEAGVTWGLSAAHRGQFGVPEEPIGTWRVGIDRLLVGLLAPGDTRHLINGLLPCDVLEGGQAAILAALVDFYESFVALMDRARLNHSPAEWRDLFAGVIDRFFGADEALCPDRRRLLAILDGLVRQCGAAGNTEPLSLDVIVTVIKEGLEAATGNFLSCGRITLCQMVPMRSIPFKVICLLGMNDSVFPRQERRPGFDLMADSRLPGDRNRRDDDRYLFLETILSAREVLYISYVGMNAANAPAPPSAVVSELLDHLAERLGLTVAECEARFVTRHPLQPFSRRYFSGELFSYSRQDRALAASLGAGEHWPGLFGQGFVLEDETLTQIGLDDLIRFFLHPVRYLLQRRLGLYLDAHDDELPERERFSLDALETYSLTQAMLQEALADGHGLDLCPMAQIRGQVALGMTGRCQYEAVREEADALAERLVGLRGDGPLPTREIRLDFGGCCVSGELGDLWEAGQILCRPGKLKNLNAADLLRSWIRHLALCAASPDAPWQTIYLFRDGLLRFPYLPDSRELLTTLVDLYRSGLNEPLPLFANSSLAFAQKLWQGKGATVSEALAGARKIWQNGDYLHDPECAEPYLAAAYGDRNPVTASGARSFVEVAELVLAPALRAATVEKF